MSGDQETLVGRVGELIDRARLSDIQSHRLEVVAARRYRQRGLDVPRPLADEERLAAVAAITCDTVLERSTAAYRGRMIVLKGPAVARLYPDPALRGYGDLDLLAEDAEAAQAALIRAGFVPVGPAELYRDIHHLQPLRAPGLALSVEVHSRVKWIDGLPPPSNDRLFSVAQPFNGSNHVLLLPPAEMTILLAAHSWAHEPLRRLRDILDIALALASSDRREVERLADAMGVRRLWNTTRAAVATVFAGAPPQLALRSWARNLPTARERTVLENHLQRWSSDFWALPPTQALRRLPRNIADDFHREEAEPWRAKALRASLAIRNARRPRSAHENELRERSED